MRVHNNLWGLVRDLYRARRIYRVKYMVRKYRKKIEEQQKQDGLN